MSGAFVVAERLVVTFTDKAGVHDWVLDKEDVIKVGGKTFLGLRHSDRGFAKFVGAASNQSNPLKPYVWLDELRALRNSAVNTLLEAAATERDPTHVSGKKTVRSKYESNLPRTIKVKLPIVELNDTTVGPLEVTMKCAVNPLNVIVLEASVENLAYVRAAMQASKVEGDEAPRKRPRHTDRLSTTTGVHGVFRKGRDRIFTKYKSEGKEKSMTMKRPDSADDAGTICRQLKARVIKVEDDDADDGGKPGDECANENESAENADDGIKAEEIDNPPEVVKAELADEGAVQSATAAASSGHADPVTCPQTAVDNDDEPLQCLVATPSKASVAMKGESPGLNERWGHIFKRKG